MLEGKGMVKLWKDKIFFFKYVKYLVNKGYLVLMYDFRSYGNSEEVEGNWVFWGF